MRRALRICCRTLLIWVVALVGCVHAPIPVQPATPMRAPFSPVKPERWTLSNGLRVIYMEDHELPVVGGGLYVRGGSFWEDINGGPVVEAMGAQMREGGAGPYSADQLDAELEKLAASVSSGFGGEYGTVSFGALSNDFIKVFELFSEVVRNPRFEQFRLRLWKGRALEAIRRRRESPSTIASLSFSSLIYGETVYGNVSRSADVERVSREALLKAHARYLKPDRAILVVAGAVKKDEVKEAVERFFGSWAPAENTLPEPPPAPSEPAPGITFIAGPFQQATVVMGQLGVPRLTEDYPAIEVFNEVFGTGGFGTRLMQKIRTELGLAYSVYGLIQPALVRGVNIVNLQTKSKSAGDAVAESVRAVLQIQNSEPTAEELRRVKDSIANSFVFKFASLGRIADRTALLETLGYPSDYDQHHLEKIGAVDGAAVREVAVKRWDPSKFVIVVVGEKRAYCAMVSEREQNPDSVLASLPMQVCTFNETLSCSAGKDAATIDCDEQK